MNFGLFRPAGGPDNQGGQQQFGQGQQGTQGQQGQGQQGDGNGGQGQQGQQGSGNGSGEQQQQTNLNPFAKPASVDGNEGTQGQQQTAQNNGNAGEPAGQAFDNFVKSMDFTAGIDQHQLQKDLQDPETAPDAMAAALQSAGANAFKNAMLMMNKVLDKRLEQTKQEAIEGAQGKVNTDQAFNRMFDKLPWTKDESRQSVAKAVLSGFILQGQGVDEAIQNVGKYFEQQTRDLMTHMGMQAPNGGGFQFGAGGENTNGQQDGQIYEGFGDHSKAPDWFNVLAG